MQIRVAETSACQSRSGAVKGSIDGVVSFQTLYRSLQKSSGVRRCANFKILMVLVPNPDLGMTLALLSFVMPTSSTLASRELARIEEF